MKFNPNTGEADLCLAGIVFTLSIQASSNLIRSHRSPDRNQYRVLHLLIVMVAGATSSAAAQSLTSASLAGTVQDARKSPVFDVSVTARNQSSGLTRHAVTSRVGRFTLSLLPPGRYEVLAEAIGYRPKRILNVPVLSGQEIDLTVDLEEAPPPVNRVDTVFYSGAAASNRGTGMSQRFSLEGAGDFPDRTQDVSEQLRHASNVSGLAVEGLPNAERTLTVDGVPFVPARHPGLASDPLQAMAFPSSGAERLQLAPNPADVEFRGAESGFLILDTRRGSNDFKSDAYADWSGQAMSGARYFLPRTVPHSTWRGAADLSGAIIRDTATFVLGAEGHRAATAFPSLTSDVASAALAGVARDSFQQDLGAYGRPRVSNEDVVSGFGRVDWQLSGIHSLSVRANVGVASLDSPVLEPSPFANPASRVKATDFGVATVLASLMAARVTHEVRLGISSSKREYLSGTLPTTIIQDPTVALGADPVFPGRFARTEVHVTDVLHVRAGPHTLKLGAEGAIASIDNSYTDGGGASFTFANAGELARRRGVFAQTVAAAPAARFALPQFGAFLQDGWLVAPGFRFTLGLRFDDLRVPQRKVIRNDSLLAATGLDNSDLRKSLIQLSPRVGFSWTANGKGTLVIRAAAGLYSLGLDPTLLSEVITNSGRVELRSAVGTLPSWPTAPDPNAAPTRGRDVTIYGTDLRPPRQGRLTLGLSQALGASGAFHLSGTYNHTDFLPRRHDLNLPIGPFGSDTHGQPVYGELQQFGGVLAATPGANRRFPGFNRIWSLDGDGFSDYWGVTASLERESRAGLRLLASYTYSQAKDNWLSHAGLSTAAQLTPFPGGLQGLDWADGISDFDTPHHVSVGLVFPTLRGIGARFGFFYSYRSGYPFTPGFRDGVDVNGDGSAVNDVAFIADNITGTTELFGAWPCLQEQNGRIAARNSCRSKGVHSMDARFRLATIKLSHADAQIVVDALNLLDQGGDIPDRALYLVNPGLPVTTNPVTGVVTIPLMTNPHFGQPLVRQSAGRSVRVGLRLAI